MDHIPNSVHLAIGKLGFYQPDKSGLYVSVQSYVMELAAWIVRLVATD